MKIKKLFIVLCIGLVGLSGCDHQSSEEVTSAATTSVTTSVSTDPYENMTAEEFYENYQRAKTYEDVQYRSAHYFMSGLIGEQTLDPTIYDRPSVNGKLVKNSTESYIEDKDGNKIGYNIVDSNGETVDTIFYGGGYVNLEEVAAYVYAFGEVPPNQQNSWRRGEVSGTWGYDYARTNFDYFSDDFSGEADLPDNYGGDVGSNNKKYYEMDIGTNGLYSNGKEGCEPYTIYVRGIARMVFTYSWSDDTHIDEASERYAFYTYNHYDDFQEYLNYWGGWGEMFGYGISAGRDYVETISMPISQA